ncbi:MAG: hypothetical protein HKL96_10830 [Phycisphaerales bacterium]|nr:hypothetical protein [Phycisphaerales bacterium]
MKVPSDLRAFVASLNAADVKYLIVGGYAVAFHGRPRFTGGMDIFVARSPDNAEKLIAAIAHFGFEGLNLTTSDFLEPDAIVQLGYPPNRIDLLTNIDAVSFDEAYGQRVLGKLDDIDAPFISRHLLKRNKLATGRPKDIADADSL